MYSIVYTKKAVKDIPYLQEAQLSLKAKALIEIIREKPFQTLPPFEKLQGDFQGVYSRRINLKHRLVYLVIDTERTVKIISMWSNYEF